MTPKKRAVMNNLIEARYLPRETLYTPAFSLAANFSRIFFTLGETVNMQYGW
jgi:hypothetical protein